MKIQMLFASIAMAVTLSSAGTAASEDGQVTFTCKLNGSNDSGFDIIAANSGHTPRNCKATCSVTKHDGSTQSWEYRNLVRADESGMWFGGEAGVKGSPLKDPKITSHSCD